MAQPAPGAQPERFLIYRPGDTAADRPDETYEQRAVRATKAHLATRLGLAADQILVISESTVEVQQAAPCGSRAPEGSAAAPAGIVLGREVVLQAGGISHRYIVVGGLGYYCGETVSTP